MTFPNTQRYAINAHTQIYIYIYKYIYIYIYNKTEKIKHRNRHTRALHVHEVGVGALYQALKLVLRGLRLSRGVQQITSQLQMVECED